ncbi:lysozyme inhibitor LprI family protein [Pseudomonas kermanshahensis]|uniref:lysozyme inhibitor LprI family protein n=1 Tax=Pseudomonas kermanshahensis TaxID=2745482 RepID=UPI0023DC5322|nr:lysozyme inhibitor LprI family protein [Pseudomonas kermanshahensis]WEL56731.1 lysozyme inhibitor LprI family protein [Pseudomonas kermanshahensis]
MAKAGKYVLEERITEVRSRWQIGKADAAFFESSTRVNDLRRSLKAIKGTKNVELFRHFPVAAIALLEAYFRSVVSVVVDAGGDYFPRGLGMVGDKLKAAEAIAILHKKSVSIGEAVAYSLPFSSLGHLESTLDQLLGQSLKGLVKTAVDPHELRRQEPAPNLIVADVSALWADLQKIFEARHVLAHEAATKFDVSYDLASLSVESVSNLIEAIEAVLWSTVWKDEPLTQQELNRDAYSKYRDQRKQLSVVIRRKRKEFAGKRDAAEFRALHAQWKSWVERWARYNSERFEGGSIQPMIHASVLSEAYEIRIKQVQNVTGY